MQRYWLGLVPVLLLYLGGCPAALDDHFLSVPSPGETAGTAGSAGLDTGGAGGAAVGPSGASNQGGTDATAGTTASGGNASSGGQDASGGAGAGGDDGMSGAGGDDGMSGAGGGAGAAGSNGLATLSDFCVKCSQCFAEPGFNEGFCAPFIGASSFNTTACQANGNPANLTNPDETLTRLKAMTCTAFDAAQ